MKSTDAHHGFSLLAVLRTTRLGLVVFLVLVSLWSEANEHPRSAVTSAQTPQPPVGKISFIARPDGVDHIYVMNPDGTNITRLTSGPDRDYTPEWSFNGKRIVFQRNTDGDAVYTMKADGSKLRRLSPTPSHDGLPGWSPDGTHIVFARVTAPPRGPNQLPIISIMEMNADGSDVRAIYSNGSFNMEPRYSPDGKKIIFMCGKTGVAVEICTTNPDGSGLEKLTNFAAVHGDPHWSHDGKKIAFGSNREGGGKLNIFVMNADGSNVTQLTHFPLGQEAGDVGWSPDDKQMAFEWDKNGHMQGDPKAYAEIWMMNADGANEHSIGVQCSGVGCAPRWQPN